MKTFLFFYFTVALLWAQEYILKDSYEFDDTTIYASDFFPDIENDFIVITLPEGLQQFKVSKQRIIERFAKHHITLKKSYGLVHFKKISMIDTYALKAYLREYYLKHYPFLEISAIKIEAKNMLAKLPKHYTIELKKQAFRHPKGTLKILTEKKRFFFSYELQASYNQLYAKSTLLRGSLITRQNSFEKKTPFRYTISKPLDKKLIGYVVTRRYIKEGMPIRKQDVILKPLVKRHAIVNVKLIEGNILINFSAMALKDGALGDIITIQKSDKKRLKAKVIGKNRVIIE